VHVLDLGTKKRKDYAFRRQFNEKPSIIPGCPDLGTNTLLWHSADIGIPLTQPPISALRICALCLRSWPANWTVSLDVTVSSRRHNGFELINYQQLMVSAVLIDCKNTLQDAFRCIVMHCMA